MLYKQTLTDLEKTQADMDMLKSEMEAGSYITTEEADALLNEAVDSAVNSAIEQTGSDYKNRIRGYMEEGKTLTMLENLFPDNIVVPDISGYRFFDINSNLNLSEVDYSAIEYPVENEKTGKYDGVYHVLHG